MRLETGAGMHRFSWDMRYAPLTPEDGGLGGVPATGAVPHRTYPQTNAPWAPPGNYRVRLKVGDRTATQPLVLKLDPRVRIAPTALAQLTRLTNELYSSARTTRSAYNEARGLVAVHEKADGPDAASFKAQVESLAPAPRPRGGFGGGGFGGGAPATPPTLESASNALLAAAMALQRAELAPTASQVAAAGRAREQARAVLPRWTALKTTGLAALNAKRKAAGQPPIGAP
jgi:hypothetical protein